MSDDFKSTIAGGELEQADRDGAEWHERELIPAGPTTSIPLGEIEAPATYRAKIMADVAEQFRLSALTEPAQGLPLNSSLRKRPATNGNA